MADQSLLNVPLAAALAIAPVSDLVLVLVLFVAGDVVLAVLIGRLIGARRRKADDPVVVIDPEIPLRLIRRTEPALRSRRPAGIVEMQVRWRHAAEAHRRARERR